MALDFKGANAVILAPPHPQFNPAAVSQAWMIGQLHVAAGEFVENSTIQFPFLFITSTRRFALMVAEERIQVTPSLHWDQGWGEEVETVRRVANGVVRLFQGVPCPAIGLNFWWTLRSEGRPNRETSRRLFFGGGNSLFNMFNVENAAFGAYASKDIFGCRLKVDAKPVNEQTNEPDPERILFTFNFHLALAGDDRVEQIDRLLLQWDDAKAEARRVAQRIHEECGL
jgi:hypothetical protein